MVCSRLRPLECGAEMRMPGRADGSALRDSKWSQYALRFLSAALSPRSRDFCSLFPQFSPRVRHLLKSTKSNRKKKVELTERSGEDRLRAWMPQALPWGVLAFLCSP